LRRVDADGNTEPIQSPINPHWAHRPSIAGCTAVDSRSRHAIAPALGYKLALHEECAFEDGEHKVRRPDRLKLLAR
jgi:hypothetical protein